MGGICLQKRGRQEVSINCKWLVFRWIDWVIVCKNRGCSSVVLRSWGHEVMRSWRSWRWMQSANGYTFPKEIIIYNIYYIYYILLFIYCTYGFVSNPGKMLTIWNRLHLCWGLHDLHDLMTSWPHDHFTKRVVCSFEAPAIAATPYWQTKGLMDRNLAPIPGFNSYLSLWLSVQYTTLQTSFLSSELRRNWDGNPFWFRLDSDDYFISSLDT